MCRHSLVCEKCGKPFECCAKEARNGRRFCSFGCMIAARRRPVRVCLECGIEFRPPRHTNPKKGKGLYCTKKCAGAARRAGKREGKWQEASDLRQCRARVKPSQKMHAEIMRAMSRHMDRVAALWKAMNEWRPCKQCGGSLKPHAREFTEFCSIKCAAQFEQLDTCRCCGIQHTRLGVQGPRGSLCRKCKRRAKNKSRKATKGISQRAKKYGVNRSPYNRQEVFSRDRWLCQLCGVRLRRKWTYNKRTLVPHPHNATIDHIVPMSRGGDDAEWNLQACCLLCNGKKSAASIGQRRLKFE
jgi:hypothetical protein